jgi:hypothetical protein
MGSSGILILYGACISVVDDFVYSWNTEVFVDHIIGDIPWGIDSCS